MGEAGHYEGLTQDTLLVTIFKTTKTKSTMLVKIHCQIVRVKTYDAKNAIKIIFGFSRIDCQIVFLGAPV